MPETSRSHSNSSRRRVKTADARAPLIAERSVGAVVFAQNTPREYLLLFSSFWEFPKGHGNANETETQTARRETAEETGLEIEFVPGFREVIDYHYHRSDRLYKKQVIFFLAQARTHKVQLSSEHTWFEWHSYETALTRLTYENSRLILRKAEEFLNRNA